MVTFNIKNLRNQKKITQKDLASTLKIRTQTLGDFENNNGKPKTISISLIDGLCEQLDCTIGELMTYTPNGEINTQNNSQSLEETINTLNSTIKELRNRIDSIEKKDN